MTHASINCGRHWVNHISSAAFQRVAGGATLRIGYVDPKDNGLQLIESSVPPATLMPAELSTSARPIDTYRTEGRVWRRYSARPGEQALVLAETGRTVIVVGRTTTTNLEKLAGSIP